MSLVTSALWSAILIASAPAPLSCELRFTTEDACTLANEAESNYSLLKNQFIRMKELAIEGSNGVIGEGARRALNSQYQQQKLFIHQIISEKQFQDSFLLRHFYVRDGITF